MFQRIIFALLEGRFLCAVTDYDAFEYLRDGAQRKAVDAYLAKVSLTLRQTDGGAAFFAAQRDRDDSDRRAAKKVFEEIKFTLRPAVEFFSLVMDVQKAEDILMPGARIETVRLMAAMDENPVFLNELQTIAGIMKVGAAETDNHGRLLKILKRFTDEGYLLLLDGERVIYTVTGKIEFLHEAIEFLMAHDGIEDAERIDAPDTPAQGGLW